MVAVDVLRRAAPSGSSFPDMAGAPELDPLFLAFQLALAGQYSIEREIGRGGMGVVYLAREVRLDRPVAIKLLPPERAADERLRERFLREARLAAKLSHPNIIPIHAVDDAKGFVFYVMAFVDGETLAERVRSRGPLPPSEGTRIVREALQAVTSLWSELRLVEAEHGLDITRAPDWGLVPVIVFKNSDSSIVPSPLRSRFRNRFCFPGAAALAFDAFNFRASFSEVVARGSGRGSFARMASKRARAACTSAAAESVTSR